MYFKKGNKQNRQLKKNVFLMGIGDIYIFSWFNFINYTSQMNFVCLFFLSIKITQQNKI